MEELVLRMLLQGLRLLKIQSIDVKPGELAIVLQQGRSKNQKDPGGLLILDDFTFLLLN
jgi:hypothetical protein